MVADRLVTVSILKEILASFRVDLVRDIREETHALIAASENRLRGEIQQVKHELRGEIQQSKIEIIEFIDDAVLPQIAEHDAILIKHKLKAA